MLEEMGKAAKAASYQLSQLSAVQKNQLLLTIADDLAVHSAEILQANAQDVADALQNNIGEALLDRLTLTSARLQAIILNVRQVARLKDPVGEVIDGGQLDSGLRIERRRVPLGVVAVIYEARPDVTIDVATLCLKTGNTVILRGGKETYRTNNATVAVIQRALLQYGLPVQAVQTIESPDREWVNRLLKLDRYIDMLIPRGGAGLHKLCRDQSTIPVITGGIGVCHLFVDQDIAIDAVLKVIINAKKQRPSACNSLETLLVHQDIVSTFLPALSRCMAEEKITLHADKLSLPLLKTGPAEVLAVKAEDFNHEWLSLDLNVRLVADIDQAIEHIREHGTQHSDGILTRNINQASYFVSQVDSAAVYVNASTRFTDGAEFGLGAEVAVSTQKLHARGPMGLESLTSWKWVVYGDNTLRQ